MILSHISKFKKGWFLGDFDQALTRTKNFEVALQTHPKGYVGEKHFHMRSTEYNLVVSGKMILNNIEFGAGDIFVLTPNETSDSEFLEDTTLVVVRTPSDPTDKYIVS